MTRAWYESEMMRQLNDTCTYKQCAWNAFTLTGVQAQIKSIAQKGERCTVIERGQVHYRESYSETVCLSIVWNA